MCSERLSNIIAEIHFAVLFFYFCKRVYWSRLYHKYNSVNSSIVYTIFNQYISFDFTCKQLWYVFRKSISLFYDKNLNAHNLFVSFRSNKLEYWNSTIHKLKEKKYAFIYFKCGNYSFHQLQTALHPILISDICEDMISNFIHSIIINWNDK